MPKSRTPKRSKRIETEHKTVVSQSLPTSDGPRNRDGIVRVAIYSRTAVDGGVHPLGQCFEWALHCRNIIAAKGNKNWTVIGTYEDAGVSGMSVDRPAMAAMIGAIKRRQIDVVVTRDVARFSRKCGRAESLLKVFAKNGVTIFTVGSGALVKWPPPKSEVLAMHRLLKAVATYSSRRW